MPAQRTVGPTCDARKACPRGTPSGVRGTGRSVEEQAGTRMADWRGHRQPGPPHDHIVAAHLHGEPARHPVDAGATEKAVSTACTLASTYCWVTGSRVISRRVHSGPMSMSMSSSWSTDGS